MIYSVTSHTLATIKIIAVGLCILLLPIFLVCTNVRLIINWPWLYNHGFEKYDISSYTGIDTPELISAGEQIRNYFNNDDVLIDLRITIGGIRRELFNRKEVMHMYDVKKLVHLTYTSGMISGLYIALFSLCGFALSGKKFYKQLVTYFAYGGSITLGLVTVIGIASLTGFEDVFYAFHLVSFSNDLWQLDPNRDYLIAMFPEHFFYDATMWVAGLTVVQSVLLVSILASVKLNPFSQSLR